jgi:YesN/AraC family two-component response regulator
MDKYQILLADDDPLILQGTGDDLMEIGYNVSTAENGEAAIELLENNTFHLVITDLVMNEITGIDVLKKAKELNPEIMVIILTGHGDMTSAIEALRLDADDYLLKPCEPEEIHFKVKRCLEQLELKLKIKTYENILPICCVCDKIRDDSGKEHGTGEWMRVDKYIWKKAGLHASSTLCPECAQKVMEDMDE